jgi:hypothetical protein
MQIVRYRVAVYGRTIVPGEIPFDFAQGGLSAR